MVSLMEKATSRLELVDLSKHNFRRTLDSLQEGAHSLLLLSVQWKEIEAFFDSTKSELEERGKELEALEESIKARALVLEQKEEEFNSIRESFEAKLSDLEKKEKNFLLEQKAAVEKRSGEVEQLEEFTKRIESMEKVSGEKVKELELKVKELQQERERRSSAGEKLVSEFKPLLSLLAKNMGESSMPTSCSSFYPSENATDLADDLVSKNEALARMIQYVDPAKLVLDAIQGSVKEYLNKDFGDSDYRRDRVFNSCILLLEKMMLMKLRITREVKQEATQLGTDWIGKAKTNPNNDFLVFCCLVFLAAYGLAYVTTREVLFTLSERFLLYEQAPELFRHLGLEDKVSGVVETLKKKDEYLATLRFICEFRSSKLCPGWRPGAVLHEFLNSSERAARVIAGPGNSMEAKKARREKKKADAVMALNCIRKKNAESTFSPKVLKRLSFLTDNVTAPRAMEPVPKSCEKRQNTGNAVEKSKADSFIPYEQIDEAKRQRLTQPITPLQNSTVDQVRVVSIPYGEKKIEESGVNHQQPYAKAANILSTETEPNILSGSINADTLRKLLEKQPPEESDLSNAIKSTPDPAKLVLDTSMALCPKNPEGGYDFKLLVTSDSCSLLLDQLKKLPLQIGHPVKGDAKKLASHWKDKISKSKTDELEVVCFLKFLGIFGIVSEFKANDLLGLLDSSYWQTVSPDLCQFLGLDNAITGFIQNLIKTGRRLKAVDYIYSFGMVHRFHPVSAIINDALRITKESAEKSFRDAKNESAPQTVQVAAIDRQIKVLRAAIRCISCHKLESEFQLGDLEAQIKSLLKLRRNLSDGSGSRSKPDVTVNQSQTAIPPNSAEVGSVTSHTPSELSTAAASSSASKPGSKRKAMRGKKRSFSGNGQSSGQDTSHPRNNFQGHDYSLNERLTYPVDHYSRGFREAPNADYNHNQWTQPEEPPQYYQCYQHYDPFYRNGL